jgi:hypothetical protein
MIRGHLDRNDHSRQLAFALVVPGNVEEGGYGLRVADLEKLADLWPFAIVGVKGAQQGTRRAGFRGLIINLAVNNFAALHRIDNFERTVSLADQKMGKDEDLSDDWPSGEALLYLNELSHFALEWVVD